MSGWRRRIIRLADRLGEAIAVGRHRLLGLLRLRRRPRILPFRGYGTRHRVRIAGRVLEDRRGRPASGTDSRWKAMRDAVRRLVATPVPYARLRVRMDGGEHCLTCDARGAFDAWVDPGDPLDDDRIWHELQLELVGADALRTATEVLTPAPSSRLVVFSDIDDTVVPTAATHFVRMIWRTFFTAAHARLPFPGVAAFYRALHGGAGGDERNPLLYVSRGPWTVYEVLTEFFQLHDIPVGPVLFLRRWGLSAEGLAPARTRGRKYRLVEDMLGTFADLPFILVGDSGQKDPEIYTEVVQQHPERVLAVYIRSIDPDEDRQRAVDRLASVVRAAGSELVLAQDTATMARHAADRGFIARRLLPEILQGDDDGEQEPDRVT